MNRNQKKKRTYYSPEQKKSYLALYRRWNGSLNSFCEYNQLPPATFRKWVMSNPQETELEFVELAPKAKVRESAPRPNDQITISFPNGIQVQLPFGCDEGTVLSVCSVLGGL